MRAASAAILPLLSAVEAFNAARDLPGATIGPGYIHLPVTRQSSQAADGLQRRGGGPETSDLINAQNSGYMINSMPITNLQQWLADHILTMY